MLRTRICLLRGARVLGFRVRPIQRAFTTATKPLAFRQTKQSVERSEIAQKARCSSIESLYNALESSISDTDDHELIASRVKEQLDHFIPLIFHPHDVYEHVIRFLISRCCLPAAAAAYERMVSEGLLASPSLEAHMLVVAVAVADEGDKAELLASLHVIIKNSSFTYDDLLHLLETMTELHMSSDTLNTAITEFYKAHHASDDFDPEQDFYKKVVGSQARVGEVQQALNTLYGLPDSKNVTNTQIQAAYTSFIGAIRDTRPWDRDAISTAFSMMDQQGLKPNISIFNALISYEVRTNSLYRPFAIYQVLKTYPDVLPDDFTFGSLFNVLNRLYNTQRRKTRRGRIIPDDGVVLSPRQLYRDMIEALVRDAQAPGFELTTSLLNVVLRAFLYKQDYAGAFVAIRCFTALRVPMNVKTYTIVYRHLMNRITSGLRAFRRAGDDKWSDRFLGLPYPVDRRDLSSYQAGNALASRLLDVSRRRSFKLSWPLYIGRYAPHEEEPEKYQVPTVEDMTGANPNPTGETFRPVPLERLLRKAILADSESMRRLGYGQAAHSYVSDVVASAKDEMIPPKINNRLRAVLRRRQKLDLAWL